MTLTFEQHRKALEIAEKFDGLYETASQYMILHKTSRRNKIMNMAMDIYGTDLLERYDGYEPPNYGD